MDMSRQEFIDAALLTPTTARTEKTYKQYFEPDPDELILDLGSGRTIFNELPNVVQLDFAYTNPYKQPENPGKAVAAIYQELPFRDAVFDRVTCRWGNLFLTDDGAVKALSEALRVVKPEGLIQFTPIVNRPFLRESLAWEQASGYEISREPDYLLRTIGWSSLSGGMTNLAVDLTFFRAEPALLVLPAFISATSILAKLIGRKIQTMTIKKTANLMEQQAQQDFAQRFGPTLNWLKK